MEHSVADSQEKPEEKGFPEEHGKNGLHTKPPLGKVVPFWSTIIPVLVSRQLLQSMNTIFKPFGDALEEGRIQNKGVRFFAANLYSLIFGASVVALSGAYAKSSLQAMKTLYADPVAEELGKKREDVTYGDILFKSKNAVVRSSVREFKKENIVRSLVLSTFFLPWHLLSKDIKKPHNIQAAVGAGAMGLYTLGSRFNESESALEALQNMVDTKIHHRDTKPYDIINADDIGQLLLIQRKAHPGGKAYAHMVLDTPERHQEMRLAQRIADLLNATYHNTGTEHSHFTLSNFIYLLGNNPAGSGKSYLEQPFPMNMAYVELASRQNIAVVEQVTKEIAQGVPPQEAFAARGVAYDVARSLAQEEKEQGSSAPYLDQTQASHASRVKAPTSYAQRVQESDYTRTLH